MLRKRTLEEIIGAAGGAATGVIMGSISGELGAVIGAVVGGIGGLGIGAAIDSEESRVSRHDHELDRVIGVEGGDIGARPSEPPPALDEGGWFI
jgi:hypothetical protein